MKWEHCRTGWLGMIAVIWGVGLSTATAEDISEQGRRIFEEHREGVVTLRLVIESQFSFPGAGSQSNESKLDTTGTVIDPTGLTVLSLTTVDPSSLYKNFMSGMARQGGEMDMNTDITDVKILLPDYTELPAQIVLRDPDLDLAFVRPTEKPKKPLPYISLEENAEAQILDQIISLNRLGRVAGRAYSASVERINAVVKTPRTFYVPGNNKTLTGLGSPAFALDGKLVGLFVMRSIKSSGGSPMGMMSSGSDNMSAIIVPAEAVRRAAEQAPPWEE